MLEGGRREGMGTHSSKSDTTITKMYKETTCAYRYKLQRGADSHVPPLLFRYRRSCLGTVCDSFCVPSNVLFREEFMFAVAPSALFISAMSNAW